MPVIQKIAASDDQLIALWKIDESLDELKQSALKNGVNLGALPVTENEQRLKQWFATRLLIRQFYPGSSINYDEFGKPLLNNGLHLSISHSKHFVCVHFSANKPNGIDIEEISPKAQRIKHKFLGNFDYSIPENIEELVLCWSAKEALYKYYGKKSVNFKDNLHLMSINFSNQSIDGYIKMPSLSENIQLKWEKIDNFVMVYTI